MMTVDERSEKEPQFDQDDPKNAGELERLKAKLARYKKEADRLAEIMREKLKKM